MGGFCPGDFVLGGFCPGGNFVQGDFVQGILSGGGVCPGDFVLEPYSSILNDAINFDGEWHFIQIGMPSANSSLKSHFKI